ncbi:LysM and BON domain-containing protein [Lysobacter sp. HDW10]|uniref:LysM and BON domain-containing protein n=1 Tax=Lysobacter sp. HDW10 TaxID=2714936 RepID=UPI0014079399|nr:LysM and BON domain-containing protein [Lysobacter sp. HDW10]QIK80212.1 LysM and BON domain-containing protein [Lysobacter sp. HDW10]
MSFIDFVKDAGEKIFKPGEAKAEGALQAALTDNGIDHSGMKIEVDGSTVTLSGQATDIMSKEKAVLIAGNVQGIDKVDDQLTVPVSNADFSDVQSSVETVQNIGSGGGGGEGWTSRTYTVEKGDTLSKISKEMYGDANKYNRIFEANKPMLKHPDKIYPGQVLRIPAED